MHRFLVPCLVVLVGFGTPAVVAATSYDLVVGISPYLSEQQRTDVRGALLDVVLRDVPLESRVTVYDAYESRLVADVDIPNREALTRFKVRANFFAPQLRAVSEFFEETGTDGERLAGSGALRLPHFLDFVSETVARSQRPTVVLLVGSPLYLDPPYAMDSGLVPSDGYLEAGQNRSPFGCATRRDFQLDKRVHIAWTGRPFMSSEHEFAVKRLWSLFISEQGGELVTFASDVPSVFKRVGDLESSAVHKFELERGQELAMVQVGNPSAGGTSVGVGSGVALRVTALAHCTSCDVDLYVRTRPGGEELSYLNPRSRLGVHYKIYGRESQGGRGDEVVEVFEAVDLDELEVWIGFYEGFDENGVSGTLLLETQQSTQTVAFHIPAKDGDLGADRSRRQESSHWTRVRLGAAGLSDRVESD